MRTRVVVLAAGKGTRMKSELPKVLVPLAGKPILQHLTETIMSSGVDPKPVIVAGENQPLIESVLGAGCCEYVQQDMPLGTGHAVMCTEPYLADNTSHVIVLYRDHPFVHDSTKLARAIFTLVS